MKRGNYMATAVIDRFEGDKAILLVGQDEQRVVFPVSELPGGLNEGDYLHIDVSYDAETTEKAMSESMILLNEIRGNRP